MRGVIIALAAAIVAATVAAVPVGASDETDITATVNQWNDSFNKNDEKMTSSACAPEAVIIDVIPPHAWHGPAACSKWWKDYEAYSKKNVVSDGVQTIEKPSAVVVTGDRAYAVVPGKFSYKQNGKPAAEEGILTFALQKLAVGWRITGWTWTSPRP
jgi:ketosteroid isomerase-like protein